MRSEFTRNLNGAILLAGWMVAAFTGTIAMVQGVKGILSLLSAGLNLAGP